MPSPPLTSRSPNPRLCPWSAARSPRQTWFSFRRRMRSLGEIIPDSKPRRAVTFEWEGFSDGGVKVGNVFSPPVSKKQLVLKGGDDQVLKALTGKSLNVHITWPGYTPVTKRVSIVADGKPISREALLLNLCRALKDGMEGLKRAEQSEPGYLEYTLDARKSVTFRDVFISELVHCGGSDWRLQCWIPKPSSSNFHARQQAYPSPSL
ncbi:hypothetical protein DFP72DRAFT_1068542 [Ephemerocybe angulata]|uniref:Uncharacterized protein n=1 Tax=Ephemerocybe angulata TaxID=980116 RepID=A0A8H6M7W9_9AGAR|nr:hypothetical protein DFP72DRAFT_1068542 [Tulosesus angulatus]